MYFLEDSLEQDVNKSIGYHETRVLRKGSDVTLRDGPAPLVQNSANGTYDASQLLHRWTSYACRISEQRPVE
jgi:hypothetical protein